MEQASESAAAREIALERARRLVDVLHFFSDGHGLFHSAIAVAEGHGRPRTQSVVVSVDATNGDIGATPIQTGSGPAFYLGHHSHNPAWAPANEMLAKEQPNPVESLLLTSMAWSGRATKEPRRDLAFAQFAIALESLMVPRGTHEVTERLATRVTRLLSAKLRDQTELDLFREVKRYYEIRSKIVHDGSTTISNVDLFGLHMLAKWATRRMVRVCNDLGFESLDDLDTWLVQLVLGTVDVPEPS